MPLTQRDPSPATRCLVLDLVAMFDQTKPKYNLDFRKVCAVFVTGRIANVLATKVSQGCNNMKFKVSQTNVIRSGSTDESWTKKKIRRVIAPYMTSRGTI